MLHDMVMVLLNSDSYFAVLVPPPCVPLILLRVCGINNGLHHTPRVFTLFLPPGLVSTVLETNDY